MDEIFGKLPKLGEIAKLITGGDKEEEVVDTKKGEVEGKTPPLPKTNKDEVKTEKTVSGRFDMKTGKAYINDQEVAHDEYEKFANMTMKEKVSQYGQVKGNANNILPLDVSKVAKKSSSVSDYASYEDDVEVVDGQEAYNKGYSDGSSGSEQSEYEEGGGVTTIIAGNSGGSDEISARLYERG